MKSNSDIKVLIVEDDPFFQRVLLKRMGAEGYQVEAASDGREGMKAIVTFEPDLVISDMGRPPLVLLRRGRSYAARTLPASPASRHPISWGVALADFDNDGHADVLAAGGALGLDRGRQPDTLYLGNGRGGFAVAGRASGIGDGGRGRGVAVRVEPQDRRALGDAVAELDEQLAHRPGLR